MKKNSFSKTISILFYILFFLLLLKNSYGYLDPDFGWHLKAGEEVYLTKQTPHINHYNYVFHERENYWVNHEWLSDYFVFIIYKQFGYLALNIIFALIIILTLYLLNQSITSQVKIKKLIYLLFPLELLGLIAMSPHLGIRIQEISILFLLLIIIIIQNFEKRVKQHNKYNWLVLLWLIPIFFLWANLHAGFLLGIFLSFFYLTIKISERIIYNRPNNKLNKLITSFFNKKDLLSSKNLKDFFVISTIATITTLFTPYKLELFNFLTSYKNNAYLKIIMEWLPQYYYPVSYWQMIYIGLIVAIIVSIFLKSKDKKTNLDLWNISMVFLFLFLAIKSKRHFPLFFIVSLPFLISQIAEDIKNVYIRAKTKYDKFIKIYIVIIFITVFGAIIIDIKWHKNPFEFFCQSYPCQAVKFLKENPEYLDYNIFNNYGWGGYLIYTYPEKKLFIDGRLPQKEINNHSYIEEYLSFFETDDNDNLSKKINEYNIRMFLLAKEKEEKISWLSKKLFFSKKEIESKNKKEEDSLKIFLNDSENWIKLYEDGVSIIYVKK